MFSWCNNLFFSCSCERKLIFIMFLLIIFQSLFLGQSPNSLVWPKQPFKICLMFFSLVLPLELCRGTQLFIQRSFCLALILPYLITSPLTFFIPTCMLLPLEPTYLPQWLLLIPTFSRLGFPDTVPTWIWLSATPLDFTYNQQPTVIKLTPFHLCLFMTLDNELLAGAATIHHTGTQLMIAYWKNEGTIIQDLFISDFGMHFLQFALDINTLIHNWRHHPQTYH